MKERKILCSDYDGTFNLHGVDGHKRDAVRRWRAAGNAFGFVSGRALDTLAAIMAHDGVECDFAVANNGAVIADGRCENADRITCSGAIIGDLVTAMFDLGCPWACFSADERCTVHRIPPDRPSEDARTLEWAISHLDAFTQVSTLLPTEAESASVSATLSERFGKWVNPLQNGICIDIVPAGVDKAAGIRRLAARLGLSKDRVITVGDNVNDRAMIAAFRSYAVETAVPSIRELADFTVPGIVELIDRELEIG